MVAAARYASSRSQCATRRAPEGELGATVLETALVLPPFFLLLFGLFYFAITLFGYCNATFASRAAARYASLHSVTSLSPCNTASVQSVITPYLSATPTATATVSTVWAPSNSIGATVSVSVTLVYSVGIPFSTLKTVTVGSTAQRTIIR